MSDSKIFMVPDGNRNSIDPALMLALSQNGGFGNGAGCSKEELINTISHEYFHLLAHLSKALDITNEEELASLNGYLNMLSYRIVQKL